MVRTIAMSAPWFTRRERHVRTGSGLPATVTSYAKSVAVVPAGSAK